jgi:hypothetical protein
MRTANEVLRRGVRAWPKLSPHASRTPVSFVMISTVIEIVGTVWDILSGSSCGADRFEMALGSPDREIAICRKKDVRKLSEPCHELL